MKVCLKARNSLEVYKERENINKAEKKEGKRSIPYILYNQVDNKIILSYIHEYLQYIVMLIHVFVAFFEYILHHIYINIQYMKEKLYICIRGQSYLCWSS